MLWFYNDSINYTNRKLLFFVLFRVVLTSCEKSAGLGESNPTERVISSTHCPPHSYIFGTPFETLSPLFPLPEPKP